MDCPSAPATGFSDTELVELVDDLRTAGAEVVVVAFRGGAPTRLRRPIRRAATVVHTESDASLDELVGTVFDAPDRCVLVVEPTVGGWRGVVTGTITHSESGASFPVPLLPVGPPRIDGGAFGHALLGQVLGGGAGLAGGFGFGLLTAGTSFGGGGGPFAIPMIFGTVVGFYGGAAVGGALASRESDPIVSVIGALAGGVASVGLLLAISDATETPAPWVVVPVAAVLPALGVGFTVGTWGARRPVGGDSAPR